MQALLDEKKLFESSAPLGLAIIPIVLHTIPLREKDYLVNIFLRNLVTEALMQALLKNFRRLGPLRCL